MIIQCNRQCERLDTFLSKELGLTRSNIKNLIDGGHVLLNGACVKAGKTLKCGDIIEINIPPPESADIIAQDIPLDIIYEDAAVLVINKPRSLVVHPAAGNREGTLVNALRFRYPDSETLERTGIVHRLDKDTTGAMVIAKTGEALVKLSRQFAARKVVKKYSGIVEGIVEKDRGKIQTGIARDIKERKKMAVSANGRNAFTEYEVLRRYKNHTYLMFTLHTGRTHQIRVHAKHIGHPLLGDKTYGYKRDAFNLSGQLLHSKELGFYHPDTEEFMTFAASEPPDFLSVLSILNNTLTGE